MMGGARTRTIANIDVRKENQGCDFGETFDMGENYESLRKDKSNIIDDSLEDGDYWEHFENERKAFLCRLSPRLKLRGPTEDHKIGDDPGKGILVPMYFFSHRG